MRNFGDASMVAAAIVTGVWAGSVGAQEAGDAAATDVLHTIVVTATRREQNLQDIPLSVSVLDEEQLSNAGAEQMRDLSLPNFVFPQFYTTVRSYVSVRGIFQEANNMGLESGFATYVDGVYMGRNMAYNVDSGDIERVELLRGPQGTLFGRNTIAGLLSLTTVRPTPQFEGRAHVQLGNYDLRRVRGMLNVPIVDGLLSTRFSGHVAERKGYVRNTVTGGDDAGNIDYTGGRAQILLTPTDKFTLYSTFDYSRSDQIGYVWENVNSETGGDSVPFTQQHQVVPRDFIEKSGASLTAEYQFDSGASITAILGYRDDRTRWRFDEDGSAIDVIWSDIRDHQEQWSGEVRLASPLDGRFDYVLGLYAFDQKGSYDGRARYGEAFTLHGWSLTRGVVDTASVAAFGHANFHVTDALNLFAGLRFTSEEKNLRGERRVMPPDFDPGSRFIEPAIQPPMLATDLKDDVWSYTAGAQYTFADEHMVYGSVSTGYKSGGMNTRDGTITDPETVTSYEIGLKSNFFDRRLSLNAAAFYSEYDDLQVRSIDATTLSIMFSNAASVISKGAELELAAFPTSSLALNLGIGYVDSTYDHFPNVPTTFGGTIDASGNSLPMTPKWTVNGNVHYEWPLPGGAAIVSHLDYIYVAERYSVLDAGQNDPGFKLPGYSTVNGRIGYKAPDGRWEVYLWGKNLTDKLTPVDRRPFPVASRFFQFETYLEPRTYGASVTVNF
ncbi:MAG TPA: TonB-dependent receptor [Steroidobacter sp.]